MDQLITFLKNGYFQSPTPATEGHRILRINAVRPMQVDVGEVKFLSSIKDEATEYLIEPGDLLFTRYNGSLDLLGVAGMVRKCPEPTLHPDKLIRVKSVWPGSFAPYLEIACNVGAARRHMVRRARTTAGQTGISGGDIREMPIPLPAEAELAEIVAEVERRLSVVEAVEDEVDRNLQRVDHLRSGILKEAFAGRLVAQIPSDEPATVLLERIRQQRAAGEHVHTEPAARRRRPSSRRGRTDRPTPQEGG